MTRVTAKDIYIVLLYIHFSTADWVADWMSPVQEQFEATSPRSNAPSLTQFEDEYQRILPYHYSPETEPPYYKSISNEQSTNSVKTKLENTLKNAKLLAKILKAQILELSVKETRLKEAIANGRSGISTLTVSTFGQRPRSYIIREGLWTLCTGIVQAPTAFGAANRDSLFSTPRCIGQEVPTAQDPCVFNSVIKYETIPTQRRVLYTEDDYLCLKSTFNTTLEQYMSVPRRLINATCDNGIIRSLEDNVLQCGIRVLSEYSYFPHRPSSLPLEYCSETDGSCKLIVAWHLSNSTVENFEFLKNEREFKKFFIENGIYSPVMM